MPKFINKSWPLLLMPVWWILWILGFIFHNCYFRFRNEYRKVRPERRNHETKKEKKKKKKRNGKSVQTSERDLDSSEDKKE